MMETLREFTFVSVAIRLVLAMIAGGVIGWGRSKREQAAGLRTYMLASIGAALCILISLYEYEMIKGAWAPIVAEVGEKFDASRIGTQAISGIGFLAAGTILSVSHQRLSGLTTAAGLFASVCMGLACGAGFFELVIVTLIMMILVLEIMYPLEILYKRKARNVTLSVEFDSINSIGQISEVIKGEGARIYDIEVERVKKKGEHHPSAIFSMKLSKENTSHSSVLSAVAALSCVYAIEELR